MNFDLQKYLNIWKVFFENATLSLYSQQFYQNVYQNFSGFGIKHFFMCLFVASVINTSWLFVHFENFANYLKYDSQLLSNSTFVSFFDGNAWDKIFSDLPEIYYDGKQISCPSIAQDQVFYIKSQDTDQSALIAIDLIAGEGVKGQKTKEANFYKSRIILKQQQLIIQLGSDRSEQISLPYQYIITNKIYIDGAKLKQLITKVIVDFESNFLYKMLPLILLINSYFEVMQNLLLILITALCGRFFFNKPMHQGFRVGIFAISALIILKAILRIFISNVIFIDYYCIFTIYNASRAMMLSHKS